MTEEYAKREDAKWREFTETGSVSSYLKYKGINLDESKTDKTVASKNS